MTQDRLSFRVPVLVALFALVLTLLAPTAATAAPAQPRPIKIVTVHSNGHRYVLKVWAKAGSKNCLAHAYGGPIRHFLATHDCRHLTRYLVTTKVNGRGVGFAESAVSFAGKTTAAAYRTTGHFRALISENGTGNFYSLFHDGYSLPSGPQTVPSPDAFKALSQDTGVTSVDAWYLHGPTPANARPLIRMIKNIYLQWFV